MTLSSLVKASAAQLGIRFGLIGLLPTTLLVLFVLALLWGGAPANASTLQAAFTTITQYNTAQGLLLVIAILALAFILQPLWYRQVGGVGFALERSAGYQAGMTTPCSPAYAGYRFPAEVIGYAVCLYFRFPLSLRMVEDPPR